MHTRPARLYSLSSSGLFRGLLMASAITVVSGCDSNNDATTGIDDPALRGATVGEVETQVADMPDGTSERIHILNLADPDRAQLRLRFAPGEELSLTSGDRVGVWGDRLGDEFRVSRYVLIPAADTSVTSALIGATPKPQTTVFVIVDVGGGSNITNDKAAQTVFDPGTTFASVYNNISFGIMKMSGDVQGPFSYPMTTCDYNGMQKAVKPMVNGTYNHYMWYFGSKVSACAWSGIGAEGTAAKPLSDAWYNASTGCTVLVQEVGHNQGWMHSSTLACSGASFVADPTTCTSSEYGNRMTPMGSGCGMFNAYDLWYQSLIGGCNGVKVTASGTFNLFPLENACNGIQAIQIPMVTQGRMAKPQQGNNQPLKNYMIEYRTKTGQDSSVTQAVYVYATDDIKAPTKTSNWTWLLDMNPATSTFDGLTAGGSFTDPDGSIKITVTSMDATKAVVQVDVTGGAGAAPTCIDNTTVAAPGPTDCGSGPTTGTGGSTGAGGTTGTGGTGGTAGTTGAGGRGGTTGTTGGGGRGGTTGTTGAAGRGGTTGTTGAGGRGGSGVVTTGTGGSIAGAGGAAGNGNGNTGTGGGAGTIGTTGAAGSSGSAGSSGTTTGVAGATGTGAGGTSVTPTGAAGATQPPSGSGGANNLDGAASGGCSCAFAPAGGRSGWGGAGFVLLAAGLVVGRRRRRRR